MKVVLTVYIVSCGLTLIQSKDRTGEKAVTSEVNDGSKIQENFRHFFDSMRKNDMKNTKTYKSILAEEAAKEEEVFNLMKGALQFTRQKNANEHQRHFGNDIVIFKRETSESDNNTENLPGALPLANFIEKLKTIADSGEKIEALREFAVHHQNEMEREINKTIMAKEAEKEEEVNAVRSKMALGTFLCAMLYIETVIEHIYRNEVEICNYWKAERPHKINSEERLNKQIEPHFQKWVGFMHENRSKRHLWKNVRKIVPKQLHVDFAWSMPKMYFFCKDYVQGRRIESLKRYRTLRASGIKKPLLEYLRDHSRWIVLKKDVDYVNMLLKAAELDEVGYEWLDKQASLVIPFSLEDNCWPPDRFFSGPR